MAKLKKCKDCGTEVSKKASTCPQCGAPLKRKPMGCGALILVIIVAAIWVNVLDPGAGHQSSEPKQQPMPTTVEGKQALEKKLLAELKTLPATEYQENLDRYQQLRKMFPKNEKYKNKVAHYQSKIKRQKTIESQFSSWSGAHKGLERYVERNLKNPDSYEHVKTLYVDKGDHLLLETTYRATNSFNAVITEKAYAKVNLDGSGLTILAN